MGQCPSVCKHLGLKIKSVEWARYAQKGYAYAGRDIYFSYIHARGHSGEALTARCVHPESFANNSLQVGELPCSCSIDLIIR